MIRKLVTRIVQQFQKATNNDMKAPRQSLEESDLPEQISVMEPTERVDNCLHDQIFVHGSDKHINEATRSGMSYWRRGIDQSNQSALNDQRRGHLSMNLSGRNVEPAKFGQFEYHNPGMGNELECFSTFLASSVRNNMLAEYFVRNRQFTQGNNALLPSPAEQDLGLPPLERTLHSAPALKEAAEMSADAKNHTPHPELLKKPEYEWPGTEEGQRENVDAAQLMQRLISLSARLVRQEAESTRTPAEILRCLVFHEDPDVRVAVAENPNTPLEALLVLLKDDHVDVRYMLAENHNLESELLEKLVDDENPYVACRARKTLERLNRCVVLSAPFNLKAADQVSAQG
jgi:hypothetical protein